VEGPVGPAYAGMAELGGGCLDRVGSRCGMLRLQSLRELPAVAGLDPVFRAVRVFQGVTWIPAHGEVVGFVSTPLPRSWKTCLLAGHFRLLSWVFAPSAKIRERARAEPRLYWLTREALLRNVGKLKVE